MSQMIEVRLHALKPETGREVFEGMPRDSVSLPIRNGIDVVWHGQSVHDVDRHGLVRAFANMATLEAVLANSTRARLWQNGPCATVIERLEITMELIIPMNDDAAEQFRKR